MLKGKMNRVWVLLEYPSVPIPSPTHPTPTGHSLGDNDLHLPMFMCRKSSEQVQSTDRQEYY